MERRHAAGRWRQRCRAHDRPERKRRQAGCRQIARWFVIDHFNAIAQASAFLREHGDECALSVITRAQVLVGFDAAGARLARGLLDLFPTPPLSAETADIAASVRRVHHLKLPDAFQAALAIQHRLTLVTRNSRDFRGKAMPRC